MKRTTVLFFCILLGFSGSAFAKGGKANAAPLRPDVSLPPDVAQRIAPLRSAALIDTFVLLDVDFDLGPPVGTNYPGWSMIDVTDQLAAYFHVADGNELSGGTRGNLLPISGTKSMWCGVAASTAVPYCGYGSLPGYGNSWDQILRSTAVTGDSLCLSYDVFWDSEPGYDGTVVEFTFDGGTTWAAFSITDSLSARALVYDGTAPAGGISEGPFCVNGASGVNNIRVRFRFNSNGTWSDEDGLWPSDGAVMVDDISLEIWDGGVSNGLVFENFESATVGSNTAGIWTGVKAPAFGDFAALYPGVAVTQEDPCQFVPLFLWGFFDTAANNPYACHTPNPLPGQGAVGFGTAQGVYIHNEIWSPAFANVGHGKGYRFKFNVYKDLPLDNLTFFTWRVRTWDDPDGGGPLPLCPSEWRNRDLVYYGAQRYWGSAFQETPGEPSRFVEHIGDLIDASASNIQVAIGVIDMCGVWCNTFGSGACHSHAPLIDDICVERIGVSGSQLNVRHRDLFQDSFAGDGTLTGTSRADAAIDILPETSSGIQPGDSVVISIAPVGTSGGGLAAWLYARVQNSNAPKSGSGLGSSDTRPGFGTRWPHAGTFSDANSNVWERFRMDSVVVSGLPVANRFCVDLNDALFVPGDTILYFFGADADGTPNSGNEGYWTRKLDGQGAALLTTDIEAAAASPCEFTILPAGGINRGGDILYVDASDDRGGPAQLFLDSAFDILSIRDKVDRFDVLDPTGIVSNSLGSRVTNSSVQIDSVYRKILWDSGNVSAGTVGDGTGSPSKSDDYSLLEQFLRASPKGPGVYLSGDDLAAEWVTLSGTGAVTMRTTQMTFSLNDGNHVDFGEPVSPTLTAVAGSNFEHAAVPDKLIAYGSCAIVNWFDVLTASGATVEEFPFPSAGAGVGASAVLSRQFTNSVSTTATVVLSGFSFHYIRSTQGQGFPPARVHHLDDILTMMGNEQVPTAVLPDAGPVFANFLDDNYPNPFNPTTTIRYGVKKRGHVSLKVYNVAGQLVRTLVDDIRLPAAEYKVTWNGDTNNGHAVASGVYFYKLVMSDFAMTRKMVLLK